MTLLRDPEPGDKVVIGNGNDPYRVVEIVERPNRVVNLYHQATGVAKVHVSPAEIRITEPANRINPDFDIDIDTLENA